MANTILLFSPHCTPLTSATPTKQLNSFHPLLFSFNHRRDKREFSLLALASSLHPPINVNYLEREFGGHGVSFAGIGDNCVVRMGMENGSVANLMLPSGLITSYKAHMWHGSTLEVLHTSVSEGEDGNAVIQGGVSVGFKCRSNGVVPWSPSTWVLRDVRGSPQEFIQVELVSSDSQEMVEVKYIVTLLPDLLSSELVISNLNSLPLQLMGSLLSHITVSTPDATYAVGLEGSNYVNRQPFLSEFSIIPPAFGQKKTGAFQGLLSNWGIRDQGTAESKSEGREIEETEGEENDNYSQLTEKMSRIYTSTPRRFTIIDRGRRNSVVVGRDGFEEMYMFSPGSNHEWYGKYAYICTGASAMLKPIILGPKDIWKGGQYLHNPNL